MQSRVKKSPLRSLLGGAVALGLALAALTSLPNASAQYPGGYPGGPPGWALVPRPGVMLGGGSLPFGDYDWTGLTYHAMYQAFDGRVYHYDGPTYGGIQGWSDDSSDSQAWTLSVGGTST